MKMNKILVKSNKIVALSGGIASGKTLVRNIFESHGFYTTSADEMVFSLYKMPNIVAQISKIAPSAVVRGSVDPSKLRDAVISKSSILDDLEKILLPELKRMRETFRPFASGKTIIYEIPLLHETKQENQFDFVVDLVCPKSIRLKRAKERGMDTQLFEIMDKRQVSNTYRRKYCDQNDGYIIDTSVSIPLVRKQVAEIIARGQDK